MARVKIEEILDHLDSDIRNALQQTLEEHFPDQEFNPREVFRTFKRMVSRKCNTWETVPDKYVEKV
jgi:hypothetical protein